MRKKHDYFLDETESAPLTPPAWSRFMGEAAADDVQFMQQKIKPAKIRSFLFRIDSGSLLPFVMLYGLRVVKAKC